MLPSEQYNGDVSNGKIHFDPAQAAVLHRLDALYHNIADHARAHPLKRLLHRRGKKPVKGVYLYGSVGVGKTYLMDIFYNNLPTAGKHRTHFHRFLQYIHAELKARQGQRDPLSQLANTMAKTVKVLCFDELYVADIADAMLLGNLFNALFAAGITLMATSNTHPGALYENGLQRSLFLPAIDMLMANTDVVHLQSAMDYRLRTLTQAGVYFYPLDLVSKKALRQMFMSLTDSAAIRNTPITVGGRPIQTRAHTDQVAWFDCQALCDIPRAAQDYLALAQHCHTIFVSDVPAMGSKAIDDMARNFMTMVDIFYEYGIKLVISAEVAITDLYPGGRLQSDFKRTQSRLIEMQSQDYLSQAHRMP